MPSKVATPSGHVPSENGSASTSEPAGSPARLYYLDWLRAIAVLVVVFYHSFLPFAGKWLISNAETSDLLHAVAVLFETFGLAILFLIAGAGARFALQRRSIPAFLAERARRLLVPFAVGSVVLVPPIYYIIGLSLGTLSVSFPEFFFAYPAMLWTMSISKLGLSPQILIWIGMHLWFLAMLFIYSVLALPFFAFFTSSLGRSCVDTLARLARWRGATLLLVVPITLLRLVLAALSPVENAWGLDVFAWYAVLFLMGYLLYADDSFTAAFRRDFQLALIVALLGSSALLAAGYGQWSMLPKTYDLTYFVMMSLVGITGCAWTTVLLGWGLRARFMQRPLPVAVGEAALPVYILHYPILFGIAALAIQSPLGLEAKIMINEVLVMGVTLLLTAAVLRISVLRPLLGLRRPQPGGNPAAGSRLESLVSAE